MRKWNSLKDKVYAMDSLRQAFEQVKSKNFAHVIDRQTVKDYQTRHEEILAAIHAALKTNMCRTGPVGRVDVEKEDGSKGPLGIPTVKDRVVHQAMRQIIEPFFEQDFHPSGYGYRPNRSCQMAVAKAEHFLRR